MKVFTSPLRRSLGSATLRPLIDQYAKYKQTPLSIKTLVEFGRNIQDRDQTLVQVGIARWFSLRGSVLFCFLLLSFRRRGSGRSALRDSQSGGASGHGRVVSERRKKEKKEKKEKTRKKRKDGTRLTGAAECGLSAGRAVASEPSSSSSSPSSASS